MVKKIFVILFLLVNFAYAASNDNDETIQQLEQRINELTDQIEKIQHNNDLLRKKLYALSKDKLLGLKLWEKYKTFGEANKTTSNQETKKVDPAKAKEIYDKAYSLIKEQKYSQAETSFNNFINTYTNSEYTGPAYYWLGESFYLRKKYDKAAINYILSFNKFPKNSKADLSMLKASISLNQMKKKKEACEIMKVLKAKSASLPANIQKLMQKEATNMGCK